MRGVGVAHGGVLKQGEWYPWLVVVSLGLMSAGTTGTYSILAGSFVAPVCSDLGFDYGQFSFYFTATLLGLSFALPFLGKLIPRVVGKAWHVGVELLLIVAGAAMAFYTEVWMFILSAFVIGVCFTFTTGVCMSDVVDQWFKKSEGLAIGLAWGVNSLCVLLLSPAITLFIEEFGWRNGYLALAVISAILILPPSFFIIRFSPADKGLLPYGVDAATSHVDPEAVGETVGGMSFRSALRSPAFYLCVLFLCLVQLTCCMNQLFPTYASEVGFSPLVGGFMVSAASLFDIVFNPMVGSTCDRIGTTKAIVLWVGVSTASYIMLMLASGNSALAILAAGVNDAMFAIAGTGLPILVLVIFGSRDFGRIYSVICSIGYIVGAFGMPVMMEVYRIAGSFQGVFAFCIACNIVLAAFAVLARLNGKRRFAAVSSLR